MKKKFALLLVSVLIVSACVFSLAACDNADKTEEISDFEHYHGEVYLTTYHLNGIVDVQEWYEDREMWFSITADEMMWLFDQDIWNYRDDGSGKFLNAMAVAAKDFARRIGRSITVTMDETTFGEGIGIGAVRSEFSVDDDGGTVKLYPTDEQKALVEELVGSEFHITYNFATHMRPEDSFTIGFSCTTIYNEKPYKVRIGYEMVVTPEE